MKDTSKPTETPREPAKPGTPGRDDAVRRPGDTRDPANTENQPYQPTKVENDT